MIGCVGGSDGCQQHCQQSYALLRSYHLIKSDLRGPGQVKHLMPVSWTLYIYMSLPRSSQELGHWYRYLSKFLRKTDLTTCLPCSNSVQTNSHWSQSVTLLPSCVKCHCFKNGCCQNPGEPSPSLIERESKWFGNLAEKSDELPPV